MVLQDIGCLWMGDRGTRQGVCSVEVLTNNVADGIGKPHEA